jgi:hypothetical protein
VNWKWSAVCLIVVTASALAQAPSPAGADPLSELRPRALLIAILKALESTIADPRSVTDVVLCPATKVKYSKGGDRRPESWYVAFSMNSRSLGGGYAGRTMYGASFKAGKAPKIYKTQIDNDEGFNLLINNATRKQMKDCPAVSNEQLAELLGTSDRPTVDISR